MHKKKKRKKIRKILLVLLLITLCIYIILKKNNYNNLYSIEAKNYIKDNKLFSIYNKEYSKTLDEVLKSNKYNNEYLDEYFKIEYIEDNDFIEKINKYLNIGYTGEEINNIFKLSIKNQEKLLKLEKKEFNKYINIKNFDIDKLNRYNDFLSNNNYDIKDIVTFVNINLDKSFYTDTIEEKNPDDLLVLVNKYHYLPNNYKPNDLVYVDGAYGNQVPIRGIIKDDFIKLQNAAYNEHSIKLMPTTAFRNQSFQTTLYNNYVKSDGKEKADTYSARPGYSEHQTGLAIDLKNVALKDIRLTDDDFKWLKDNSYKYGFIIRYPQDKEYITGYQFENWHIRYVGLDNAKIIHDNNLTLEEYIDLYIKIY